MSESAVTIGKSERVEWVDVAKGLGIFLVFYGHYVDKMAAQGMPAATLQMSWIYSFHMPMFFFLVGLVYKRRDLKPAEFLKRQIRTRLLPVWIFNVLGLFIWFGVEYIKGPEGLLATYRSQDLWSEVFTKLKEVFIYGRPGYNVLTWFLVCLFMIELWQYLLRDRVRTTRALLISLLIFGALAALASLYNETITENFGRNLLRWDLLPSLMAMCFYQLGILCRQTAFFAKPASSVARGALSLVCLVVLLAVFNLNQAFETVPPPRVPLMVNAQYGNVGWFFITSLAGTGFVVYLSQLLSFSRLLVRLGGITLGLMLLDGYWHLFANEPLVNWVMQRFAREDAAFLTVHCLVITLGSLALSWPLTVLMERYAPFLLGRSMTRKPNAARVPAD